MKLFSSAFFVAFAVCTSYGQRYSVTSLGRVDTVTGLNNSGQVVGSQFHIGRTHAFIWSQNNGMQYFSAPNTGDSFADGINNAGQVVGSYYQDSGAMVAFWGNLSSGYQSLGFDGGPSDATVALGINDSDQIVGYRGAPQTLTAQAFICSRLGGTQYLRAFGGSNSVGLDINNSGEAVGYAGNPFTLSARAFLWRPRFGMLDLGDIGSGSRVATAINDSEEIVGYSGDPYVWNTRAFLRTASGSVADLGTLGGEFATANDINNEGDVVGASFLSNQEEHGYLWSKSAGMIDLNSHLDASGIGFTINSALYINDFGQIAAYGDYRGQFVGVLLTPEAVPEPRTIAVASFGCAFLLVRRRRN